MVGRAILAACPWGDLPIYDTGVSGTAITALTRHVVASAAHVVNRQLCFLNLVHTQL